MYVQNFHNIYNILTEKIKKEYKKTATISTGSILHVEDCCNCEIAESTVGNCLCSDIMEAAIKQCLQLKCKLFSAVHIIVHNIT